MGTIKLDPGKLLGFKIIADGESTARLTSPKIGDKSAPSVAQGVSNSPQAAKVGVKLD